MKKSFVLSVIAVLLTLVFIPMGFGAAAANQTAPGLSIPDSWKVSAEQIQAKQAEALAVTADKQPVSPLRGKGLEETGTAPSLPADNVSANFKADENGFITVIIDLVEKPIAEVAGELSDVSVNQLVRVQNEQRLAKEQLANLGESFEVTQEMQYAYNGIAVRFPREKLAEVQALFGMDKVHPSRTYYADLPHSVPLTGATNVWVDPGYKGEGMVVGVVDTGVDYNHPDLGGGFGNKVVAMISVAEHTGDAMDTNGHGTHVSGTMAAKAASATGVNGMAPEAKLIVAKIVQGGAGSASSESIAAAFDWMLEQKYGGLNLASINMSFGSPGGWRDASDPEQVAIQNCVNHGIFVSLSSGNEYYSAYPYNQVNCWYGEDPNKLSYYPADIGIVGGPSVVPGALSTAASWNTASRMPGYKVGITDNHFGYAAATGAPNPLSIFSPTADLPYIYCGLGSAAEIPTSVAGKIALIKRGVSTFGQKAANAQAKGAIGVIIYNDGTSWDRHDILSPTVEGSGITIPTVFSTYEQGNDLYLNRATYQTVRFDGQLTDVPVYVADKMVDFSSWGTDNNLFFKPEASAPGGGIWSTVPLAQGGYANYSGTSMAAPHVGGAAALIKQGKPAWTPEMIKIALLNTATLLTYPGSSRYFSPRLQGAGRINVDKALQTPVFVTDAITGLPYAPLGDTNAGTMKTFTLEAENTGAVDLTYDLNGVIQRYNSARAPLGLTGATITLPRGITVPAHGSVTFDVTIDLSGNTTYENIFVDGFVLLTSTDTTLPALHVPYTIFWGDWQDTRYTYDWIHNPVIDPPPDDSTGWWWYGYTWMYNAVGTDLYYLGQDFDGNFDRNAIAISPNGDGVQDNAHPLVSFMRGTPDFAYQILKSDGSLLTTAAVDNSVPKNYDRYPYWSGWYNEWIWQPSPGTVPDGSYTARLKAEIPGTFVAGSGQFETVDFPLIVDTVPPMVDISTNLDKMPAAGGRTDFTVHWWASDDRSGLWGYQIWMDGGYVTSLPPDTTSFTFAGLPNVPHSFEVVAFDNAGNYGFEAYVYDGFTMTLPPGWSFFSMPGKTDPIPAHLLADLPSGYQLREWNELTQKWINNGVTFWNGQAYWLMQRQMGSFGFSAVLDGQPDFMIHLSTGRNDVGTPYPAIFAWNDVKVFLAPGVVVTLDQAFQMKIIRSVFYWYGNTYVNARYQEFWPGYGYLFNANMPCHLVFPNPLY
ncbi:MAG: S8 family serine peptidase [Coprothermobacterota bacterium]|nr:S8 family serine peptidase [Coprothermobacterota bacterium]